ncbi:hypothetical protein [Actinophytocola gossypii]|uniref:Uncharacterized protein n=1 Tax=Actinophytocola gossypii TaxID=2812003 RepID=A0ABT2JEK4_9PSEU|nr:hypothetical protein [Actinophytocola gossypii]MCT2586305.1 hypothetical protein [Actinophytocola gossypii]
MTDDTPPPGRRTPDPVLFGTDPFPEPPGLFEDEEPTYRRPRWPMVVTILLIVMVLVGGMGIWVF